MERTVSSLNEEEKREILKLIKEGKCEIVRMGPNILGRFSCRNRNFFVKIFKRKKPFSFIFSPLRMSSSFRCFLTGIYMRKNGIDTPESILSFEKRKMGFVVEDIYVTEDIGEHLTAREALLKTESRWEKEFIIKRISELTKKSTKNLFTTETSIFQIFFLNEIKFMLLT